MYNVYNILSLGGTNMNKYLFTFTFAFVATLTTNILSQDVEEVIVTATKTEKTLQEVPVAVSVVSGDIIEKANITDILDLKAVVPS